MPPMIQLNIKVHWDTCGLTLPTDWQPSPLCLQTSTSWIKPLAPPTSPQVYLPCRALADVPDAQIILV
ncbi:hypothetical protein PCASD_07578 [Puccinia coronata f. sp. avenae]|uniref:Uncharacterized protein n=1 Tax=Puccinia coronata f. sp. avenae TaxID=200324 RepID=A0A2N5TGU4_9BASI|nr:hypothetical protein PCASD_07578 [Puccinia coronata f. sp. avenae]